MSLFGSPLFGRDFLGHLTFREQFLANNPRLFFNPTLGSARGRQFRNSIETGRFRFPVLPQQPDRPFVRNRFPFSFGNLSLFRLFNEAFPQNQIVKDLLTEQIDLLQTNVPRPPGVRRRRAFRLGNIFGPAGILRPSPVPILSAGGQIVGPTQTLNTAQRAMQGFRRRIEGQE